MADEIRRVITVDVSESLDHLDELREKVVSAGYSFSSLKSAKTYIDKLRASLIDLDETSAEYAERVEEIDKVQDKLNKAMKATGDKTKDAEGSYNALSKKMSELKKAFKATNDEAERQSLAKQIVGINDQLKEMDASIGNYQRNVGNYEAAFTKGLSGIVTEIEALGNPLAIAKRGVLALGQAFKTLIANPVGAVIMAIVVAVKALKKGFEQSETATNSLKRAFSALQPVMNAVSKVFTGFATIVGNIAEKAIPALVNGLQKAGDWMMTLLNKLGIVSDEKLESFRKSIEAQKEAVKTTQELTNREIELTEKRREFQVNEAKTALEVEELRAKAVDKEKYTAKERQKFLNDAISKERALNNQKLALAQEEYDIMKKRSELTDNDAATNDALAAAEANLYNTKREYYAKERELISQKIAAGQELSAAEKKRLEDLKKVEEEITKLRGEELDKIKEINERTELALLSDKDRELKILEKKYNEEKALLEKYDKDIVKLTKEYEKKRQEIINKDGGDEELKELEKTYNEKKTLIENSDENILNLTKEYERKRKELIKNGKYEDLNILEEKYNEEKALLEGHNKELLKLTEEYEKKRQEILKKNGKDDALKALAEQYNKEKALLEGKNKDIVNLTKEYENEKQEIANKNGLDKAKEIDERATQSLMDNTERQLAILKKKYEEEKKLLEENGIDTVNLTKEYERKVAEVKAAEGEGKIKDINDDSSLERDIADKTIQNEFDKKKKLLEIDKERLEESKTIYEELFNLDNLSEEKKQEYADKIKEIYAALAENRKQMTETEEEETMELLNTYAQVAQGIGELMGSVSDIWQESIEKRIKNGKITEEQAKKEFESSKKLQIATAIINGLAGVATAVSTAMSLGPIAGPIAAAVNSAAVITTTAAQIAKIKSTTFDGGGSSIGGEVATQAAPTPEAMEYKPQYSTNITGESEAVNLANAVNEGQKDTRVYLVESDIQEMGKRVEVREAESTF